MERAVFVPDLDRLPPPRESYDRLYLGSEFCARRLPGERELHAALALAQRRNMAFTLVTPFLDEPGLRRAVETVRALPNDPSVEVVVNDLGLLDVLRAAGWKGALVAGRLLVRQRRGLGFQSCGDVPAEAAAALRGSALDAPAFVQLLCERHGVRRFELDDLVQGTDVPSLAEGVRLSLYRPWLLVSATRNCPWVFDGRTWDRDRCARPCRGRLLRLAPLDMAMAPERDAGGGVARSGGPPAARSSERAPTGVRSDRTPEPRTSCGRPLILGGCAQFLEHRSDAPPPPGVDRIVLQPEVPA